MPEAGGARSSIFIMHVEVTLKLPEAVKRRYARAARSLRSVMDSEAPTAEQLMVAELTERAPPEIAADFIEGRKRRRK